MLVEKFEEELGSLNDGWRFDSIEVKLQTDGFQCGVWDVVVDLAFVAYADSDTFDDGTFASFLVSWLADRGVTDLHSIRGNGDRGSRVERNARFVSEQRKLFREQLLEAAKTGKLAWQNGPLIDIFVQEGREAATDLEALDWEE